MRQGVRIVRGRSVVEELQHPLVAAVAVVEEQTAGAARRINRLQDREIAGEMNKSVGIGWCLIQIGNPALRRSAWIHGEIGPPDEPLIGSDRAEFVGLGEGEAPGNRQFYSVAHHRPFSSVRSDDRQRLHPTQPRCNVLGFRGRSNRHRYGWRRR